MWSVRLESYSHFRPRATPINKHSIFESWFGGVQTSLLEWNLEVRIKFKHIIVKETFYMVVIQVLPKNLLIDWKECKKWGDDFVCKQILSVENGMMKASLIWISSFIKSCPKGVFSSSAVQRNWTIRSWKKQIEPNLICTRSYYEYPTILPEGVCQSLSSLTLWLESGCFLLFSLWIGIPK